MPVPAAPAALMLMCFVAGDAGVKLASGLDIQRTECGPVRRAIAVLVVNAPKDRECGTPLIDVVGYGIGYQRTNPRNVITELAAWHEEGFGHIFATNQFAEQRFDPRVVLLPGIWRIGPEAGSHTQSGAVTKVLEKCYHIEGLSACYSAITLDGVNSYPRPCIGPHLIQLSLEYPGRGSSEHSADDGCINTNSLKAIASIFVVVLLLPVDFELFSDGVEATANDSKGDRIKKGRSVRAVMGAVIAFLFVTLGIPTPPL